MLDKLKGIEERFAELERRLSDPAVIANNREYAQLARERAQLGDVIGGDPRVSQAARRDRGS